MILDFRFQIADLRASNKKRGQTNWSDPFLPFALKSAICNVKFAVPRYRHSECWSGTQWPFCWLLATHCVMKFMPSTPSATLG
jgi:hypothetical protein